MSPSFCGECNAWYPGEWTVCRDAGDGPGIEGEAGQFRAPGEGIVKLAFANGEPPSTMPVDNKKHSKVSKIYVYQPEYGITS